MLVQPPAADEGYRKLGKVEAEVGDERYRRAGKLSRYVRLLLRGLRQGFLG